MQFTTQIKLDIVDCMWSDWVIGHCSLSCGSGVRNNTRSEKVQALYGGKKCQGAASVKDRCNDQECAGYRRTPK